MPLSSGSSQDAISGNIEEMLHSYKETGKIGNTTPRDMAQARKVASAAAYSKARGYEGGGISWGERLKRIKAKRGG